MAFTFVATGESPDGSRQVFAIEGNGQIQTRYNQTTAESSGWTAWADFATPTGGVTSLCVGNLQDKRMQLFATDKAATHTVAGESQRPRTPSSRLGRHSNHQSSSVPSRAGEPLTIWLR
jgi:hypothetical protein